MGRARARAPARPGAGRGDVGAGDTRSHTDPTSVCNAERLCGITHRDGHSETGQWRRPAARQIVRIGPEQMPAVDDVTHPDRRERLSPIRAFSSVDRVSIMEPRHSEALSGW